MFYGKENVYWIQTESKGAWNVVDHMHISSGKTASVMKRRALLMYPMYSVLLKFHRRASTKDKHTIETHLWS